MIQDFQLSIQRGDKLAIIGEEGNGKSTLLKWTYDEQMISDYCVAQGTIIRNNYIIGYLAQELSEVEKHMSITGFFHG